MLAHRLRRATASYVAQGVNFDGTNDYLTRGAAMTGAADSKLWTGSFWIRINVAPATNAVILGSVATLGGVAYRTRIQHQASDNKVVFVGMRADGTANADLLFRTNTAISSFPTAWLHLMWSVDRADTAKRHLYLNDVSDLLVNSYIDNPTDFTLGDWAVGAAPDGTTKSNADIADLMHWPGVYVDLSVAANRRLFINGNGKPVDPAIAIGALGTPIIALHGPTATWETNKGSGGGFTENGALTDSSSGPSA